MAKQIDVYQEWLGISEAARPLNYYQLLKLKLFEDDAEAIRASYRQLNAHVRKYQTGAYGPQSQQLLNELAKAMLCLTDSQRKSDYDASMGRVRKEIGKRLAFEQILLSRRLLKPEQLNKVREFASAVGLDSRDALLQQKMITPEAVMQAYAESVGMPYIDLGETGIDESLVLQIPAALARNYSCVPVMIDEGQMLIASPNALNPDMEEHLRHRVGIPVRSVFCTPSDVNAALSKYYSREAIQAATAAAAKQGKPGGAKPAAAAAKKPAPAKGGPAEEEGEEAKAPAGPTGTKRKLMIAWGVCVGIFIAWAFYKMLFGH
jgi:hypothetical protein